MAVEASEFMTRMLIGVLGGALIGLERERAQRISARKKGNVPGMRTFGLISLYSSTLSYMSIEILDDSSMLVVGTIAIIILVYMYAYARMYKLGVYGITTYMVFLNTIIVGALAGAGLVLESGALSILVTLILALKTPAMRIAERIRYEELLAMLEIAALFVIIGPIVQQYSRQIEFIDVFKIYIFFTIVLGLSFTSYIAARVLGARGFIYAAILGSLVNSEAIVASVTRLIADMSDEFKRRLLNAIIPLIISMMQIKTIVLALIAVYLFSGAGEPYYINYLGLIAIIDLAIIAWSWRQSHYNIDVHVETPLSWSSAVRAALAYMMLTIGTKLLASLGIPQTHVIIGVLGGLANATATILSLASTIGDIGLCNALAGMTLSIATATLNKMLYADTGSLGDSYKAVVVWSILLSIPPVLASIAISGTCG